jgi:hypothetical protein
MQRPQGFPLMMPNFGFQPGILDYWMLLTDWRNGSFAILLALSVLLVGYALATGNEMLAGEGLRPAEGPDEGAHCTPVVAVPSSSTPERSAPSTPQPGRALF